MVESQRAQPWASPLLLSDELSWAPGLKWAIYTLLAPAQVTYTLLAPIHVLRHYTSIHLCTKTLVQVTCTLMAPASHLSLRPSLIYLLTFSALQLGV